MDKWISAKTPCRASLFWLLGRWKSRWTNKDRSWKNRPEADIRTVRPAKRSRIFRLLIFLRMLFAKIFVKQCAFWRAKRLIHIIPICAIHQKWKEKPRKIKAFQQCTQVIHKVIHGFWGFVRGRIYTCFLRKMRKFTYKSLYHRWKEKGICAGKSYKGGGTLGRLLWGPKHLPKPHPKGSLGLGEGRQAI